jgi:hypothetical protein
MRCSISKKRTWCRYERHCITKLQIAFVVSIRCWFPIFAISSIIVRAASYQRFPLLWQVASDLHDTHPNDAGTAAVTAFASLLADIQVIWVLSRENLNFLFVNAECDCTEAPSAAQADAGL